MSLPSIATREPSKRSAPVACITSKRRRISEGGVAEIGVEVADDRDRRFQRFEQTAANRLGLPHVPFEREGVNASRPSLGQRFETRAGVVGRAVIDEQKVDERLLVDHAHEAVFVEPRCLVVAGDDVARSLGHPGHPSLGKLMSDFPSASRSCESPLPHSAKCPRVPANA